MVREELIKNLKYTMEKHKNDNVPTFGTNISLMCKDILDYLEQEPSEDCVSRHQVLEVLKNNRYRFNISQEGYCEGKVLWSENLIKDDACKEIEQLPPVTPARKKGEWIGEEEGYYSECSCCGASFLWEDYKCISNWKYCPNCGAEMESEENGNIC